MRDTEQTFYSKSFDDIEIYKSELSSTIAVYQEAVGIMEGIKESLINVPTRKCLFCSGTQRDLNIIIEHADWFGLLGGSFSTLHYHRSHGYSYGAAAPEQWECQDCFTHDSIPPSPKARIWDRENAGKATFAKEIFKQYPAAKRVALDQRSSDSLWMIEIADTWYVLPGTKDEIVSKFFNQKEK